MNSMWLSLAALAIGVWSLAYSRRLAMKQADLDARIKAAADAQLTIDEKIQLIELELGEANSATNEIAGDVAAAIDQIESLHTRVAELEAAQGIDATKLHEDLDRVIANLSPTVTRLRGIANQLPPVATPETPVDQEVPETPVTTETTDQVVDPETGEIIETETSDASESKRSRKRH